MEKDMEEKLKKIKLVVLDVDGVLTDGQVWIGAEGEEFKPFHVHDGYAIKVALNSGLKVAFLTGRSSTAVGKRSGELGVVDVHQGIDDKPGVYEELKAKYGLRDEAVCCVGDDLADLDIVNACGFGVAVKGAVEEIRDAADYVTLKEGGWGAVREVIEMILKTRGEWPT